MSPQRIKSFHSVRGFALPWAEAAVSPWEDLMGEHALQRRVTHGGSRRDSAASNGRVADALNASSRVQRMHAVASALSSRGSAIVQRVDDDVDMVGAAPPQPAPQTSTPMDLAVEGVIPGLNFASAQDEQIVRGLLRTPHFHDSWQSIIAEGPVHIRSMAPGNNARASWNGVSRTVELPAAITGNDRAQILSFELMNTLHSSALDRVRQTAPHVGRDAFATAMETQEYQSVLSHHQGASEGVRHFGWDPHIDRFRGHFGDGPMQEDWNNVFGYLRTQNQPRANGGSHTDHYRRAWDVLAPRMDESRD